MPDPGLTHDAQAPNPQPAHPDKLRSQRERLSDIAGAADARVVHDVCLVADGSDDVFESVEAGDGAVDLASGVVAHDDAVAADFDGFLGVFDALDAFEAKGPTAADAFPCLDEPGDFLPAPGAAVPDAVDPSGARTLGVFFGVNALGCQALLEDGVTETEVGADAAVEGVVSCCHVIVAPAKLPGVGCEDADVEAGVEGAGEEGDCQLVIVGHVELVETRGLAVCFGDFLNGVGAGCGEAVWEVEFFGDSSYGNLSGGVVDFVDADWGEAEGRGDFMAKDCRGSVADVGVHQLSGDDAMAEESLA